jgi:hypothetical protein
MLHMLQQSCLEGLTLLSCGSTLDQLQQQAGEAHSRHKHGSRALLNGV